MPPIWLTTVGMAVETTEVSRATRKVATNRARVTSRRSDTPKIVAEPRPGSGGVASGGLVELGGGGLPLGGRRAGPRQPHRHQRAATLAVARGPDAAAVLLDDVAADVQPQTHALDLTLLGVGRPTERLEDALGGTARQA